MITSKINAEIVQDYYLQKLIVKYIKLELKKSMKILAAKKKCLILVIIQLSRNTVITETN